IPTGAAAGSKATVRVEPAAELQLTNVTSITGGIITNHGEISSTAGLNTIKDLLSGDFTNNGTLEVASGTTTAGVDGDFASASSTLVLDHDVLTNTIGSGPGSQGTVLVETAH